MAEAWMKRESERRGFLDTLRRAVMDEEAEAHRRIHSQLDMCKAIVEYFAEREDAPSVPFFDTSARRFFRTKVLPEIEEFARTHEEVLALVAGLFLEECQSIVQHFRAPLQEQEIIDPGRVFGGHSEMDEVE